MTTSTKDLIERLRNENRDSVFPELCAEAADALERLTQPVGVEPAGCVDGPDGCQIDYYSAEVVARLIAERDEANHNAHWQARRNSDLVQERDALQEQVKVLRDAAFEAKIVLDCTGGRSVKLEEALAATEPKGEKE